MRLMMKETLRLHQLEAGKAGIEVYQVGPTDLVLPLQNEAVVPHRHDHYCCFFIEHGSVEMTVDFQHVQLTSGMLLVSHPGQIHQLGTVKEFQGWVLLSDAQLLSPQLRSAIEQSWGVSLLHLRTIEQQWFRDLFSVLQVSLIAINPFLVRTEVLPSLLNALLGQAAVLLQSQQHVVAPQVRSIWLAKQFRHLVQQHFLVCKKPCEYAEKMNLTLSYLNDSVKAVTGFSVSYFIKQEILAEAQRLLFYTNLSIKEIADQLGYEDPKYFIRFFGKDKGLSPNRFRKNALAGKRMT
jgi:AraC family transcriptional activator of pobA